MLTYEGEDPVLWPVPQVVMEPSQRWGLIGRIKDRVLGPELKPHVVLGKQEQERLREFMAEVADCGVTAEDIKEATDRVVTLARGHCIRNADGTITDVSNDPNYECKIHDNPELLKKED